MAHLKGLLESLYKTANSKDPLEFKRLLDDIRSQVQISCQQNELGFLFSLLFEGSYNILNTTKKLAQTNKFAKGQEECVSFLQEMAQLMNRASNSFANGILDTCFHVFRASSLSIVKEKTISTIILVIESQGSNIQVCDIKPLRKLCIEELGKKSATSSSVKSGCFHLLGVIAQHYPEHMADYSERLLDIYLQQLKREFRGNSDLKLIEGCLKGLFCLLVEFSDAITDQEGACSDIFKYTITSIQPVSDLSRYAVPTAGLRLLQRHASHFGKMLVAQCETIYASLENWFNHRNPQLKHEAHLAMISVLKEVVETAKKGNTAERGRELFMYFINKFQRTIETLDAGNKAVSLAIQAFGLFSGLCARYMPPNYIQKMLNIVMEKCISACQKGEGEYGVNDNQLHLLPSFLFSLGNIIREVMETTRKDDENTSARNVILPSDILRSLCTLSIHMMKGFPRLNEKFSKSCCASLVYVLSAFSSCPDQQKLLLSDIVYKGLIVCCSAEATQQESGTISETLDAEKMLELTEDTRFQTRSDYLKLWSGLITCLKGDMGSSFVSFQYTSDIGNTQKLIFIEIITSAVKIVSKLDVSLDNRKDTESVSTNSEGEQDSDTVGTVDLVIFECVCELLSKLLPSVVIPLENREITGQLFISNAHWLIRALIKGSVRYPDVAGFYVLLSKIMQICVEYDYFHESESFLTNDGDSNYERKCSKLLIRKFAVEVCSHMALRSDHILTSSLYFILSLPEEVTKDMHDMLVQPLQIAFHFGLCNASFAEAATDAMLRWSGDLKPLIPESFLPVLPHIEPFLHMTAAKGVNMTENSSLVRRGKQRMKWLRKMSTSMNVTSDQNIQKKVTRFLGNLGGLSHFCLKSASLLDDSDSIERTKSTATLSLSYSLPFENSKIDIQLDYLIPRITELALRSAVKQTRITSCEVLHSLSVYIIGKSASQQEDGKHPMTEMYNYIVPVILQLACDIEPVCQKLFAPLMMQLIHWLTRSRRSSSSLLDVLLDTIMDGLVSESNSSLREFSAAATKEFLVWSIKQDVDSDSSGKNNAKFLFKRICNLATHPSAMKRLGAAVAFNQIYVEFRESSPLVDEFTFEFLVSLLDSLSMAQDDDAAIGTRKAVKEALQHIKRIVTVKSDLLNKESKNRRAPTGLSVSESVTLKSITHWLMDQCTRSQSECRHMCMELLVSFIPFLSGDRSPFLWMKEFIDKYGLTRLISKFESGSSKTGIAVYPKISLTLKEKKLDSALYWMDFFLTSLDCFMWVLKERLLTPTQIFVSGGSSNFFHTTEHFLLDIAHDDMQKVLGYEDLFLRSDYEKFNEKKCTIIVRILQFTTLMLRQFKESALKVFPSKLWSPEVLPRVVAECLLNPSLLGFNMDVALEDAEKLQLLATETARVMLNNFPEDMKKDFVLLLHEELAKTGNLLDQLSIIEKTTNNISCLSRVISAYKFFTQSKIFGREQIQKQHGVGVEKLLDFVFNTITKLSVNNEHSLRSHPQLLLSIFDSVLDLVFCLGIEADLALRRITDDAVVYSNTGERLSTRRGLLFFVTYKTKFCDEMCSKSKLYLPLLPKHCSPDVEIFIINELLEHLFAHRELRKLHASNVCDGVLGRWKSSDALAFMQHGEGDRKSKALSLFTKVITMESKVCSDLEHAHYKMVYDLFKEFITSSVESLKDKCQILPLISLFTSSAEGERQESMKAMLYELSSQHFPISFREFTSGTNKYEEYISALQILLFALELTGSGVILQFLFSLFCSQDDHPLADEFNTVLARCLDNVKDEDQKSLIDVPYKIFMDPSSPHTMLVRRKVFNTVLVPLLNHCSTNTALEFFISHIGEIMKILLEDNKKQGTSCEIREQLILKSCCYRLTESMFALLSPDQIKIDSSPIAQSFANSSSGAGSTKLLKTFLGRAAKDKTLTIEHDELGEETRLFHCAVYNAVISAVVCTQTDVKWFDVFLFSENPKKKEFLFENMIDKTKVYSFPVEMEGTQRKKIIDLRSAVRKASKASKPDYESIVYASSQVGSSLSDDASHFDNNVFLSTRRGKQEEYDLDDSNDGDRILEVTGDCLDNHECMQNLIKVIAHMKSEKIGFPDEGNDGDVVLAKELPKWLSTIIQKLDTTPHLNVKLFIVKLVITCEAFFQTFSNFLLAPMMRAVLFYLRRLENLSSIDQLVVDALVALLSWSPFAMPKDDAEEKILVRALIEILMKNVKNAKQAISLRNLDLIKTAIECWRDRVTELSSNIVFDNFKGSDPENFIGLCLLEALLANSLPPFTVSSDVDRAVYFQRIFQNILSSRKMITDMAAKVMGLVLQYYAEQAESQEDVQRIAHSMLQKLSSPSKSGPTGLGVFITSLHKVSIHYPPIATPFLELVLFYMPKLPGSVLKTCCVDILRISIDRIDNPIATLKAKDFINMLRQREDVLQFSCLKLCSSMLRKTVTWQVTSDPNTVGDIDKHQECVDYLLPTISSVFLAHSSKECREELYNIAMLVYDVQSYLPSQYTSEETKKIIRRILVQGLSDTEGALRMQVVKFWSEDLSAGNNPRVPSDSAERTVSILKGWYQPELDECGFLSSFCNLLMENTSKSSDFERAIFDHALADCTFQDQNVGIKELQGRFMGVSVPSHALKLGPEAQVVTGMSRQPLLLATQQNVQFSATVSTQGNSASSWMLGESVNTFSDAAEENHGRKRTAKVGGLSTPFIPRMKRKRQKQFDSNFGNMLLKSDEDTNSQVIDLGRLKRRFLKDSARDFRYARIASARKKREKSKSSSRQSRTVQMFRSYRIGELPDIQIPHRALISPMTALAQVDPIFLQRYMSSLIQGLTRREKDLGNSDYLRELSDAFTNILESSELCDTTLIGCIIDIIQQNASLLNVSPSILSKSALKANQLYLGIRAIEEFLVSEEVPKEPVTKRRKLITTQPKEVSPSQILSWVELARLYERDYDALQGIFSESPIARPVFSKAFSHEVHGEYVQALRIYEEALVEDMSPEPSDVEKDLWEDCLINCLGKLGRWQDVSKFSDEQTEGFPGKIWSDEHIQQRFLSTSLHAKIVLLLRGETELEDVLTGFFQNEDSGNTSRKTMLEKTYPDYIVMLHIYQKKFESARHYLRSALDEFASTWSKIDSISKNNQHATLSRLIHLSDMMDFLDVMGKAENASLTPQSVTEVVDQWTQRLPHPTFDSFVVWEDALTYRSFFLDQFARCNYSDIVCDSEVQSLQKTLAIKHLDFTLKTAHEACKRKYFILSRKFLNEDAQNILCQIESLGGSNFVCHEENLRLCLAMSSYYLHFAKHKIGGNDKTLSSASKAILESFNVLKEAVEKHSCVEKKRYQLELYALFGWTFELALDMCTNYYDQPESFQGMVTEDLPDGSGKSGLLKMGQNYLLKGVELCQQSSDKSDGNEAEIFVTYARYCDKFLQSNESSERGEVSSTAELSEAVIKYYLRAMGYQSTTAGRNATLKYPRLLQLIADDQGDAKKCFLAETAKLPIWVFIRWISQMVALLDKPEADAIQSVIQDLAMTYPQAVIYPLKTSAPDFSFCRDEIGKKNKAFVSRLHSTLDEQIPLVQHFIRNLTLLTSPSHAFKEWYEDTIQLIRQKEKAGIRKLIVTNYQNMYAQLFSNKETMNPATGDGDEQSFIHVGPYWLEFANKFRPDIDKAFGGPTGGQCLMDEKRFRSASQVVSKGIMEHCKNTRPLKLREYSPWLAGFHSFKQDHQELEIPGQYRGICKPRPEFHLKIVSFNNSIVVMSSLQQPKKITIKASDSKDYPFLIKGNEDLRQDQRIQQLFDTMNTTFQRQPLCAERNLHINTYQVVPVTSRLGMIEWVSSTKTFHEIVYDEARLSNKLSGLDTASQAYSKWVNKYGVSGKKTDYTFGNMTANANYTEVHQKYKEVISHVPKHLLRNAFLKMCSTPENFLTMRKSFAYSYGTMCAAHWLLGIGDRHTSNCLISLQSGEAVGIDFGHAFGTATEVLPVPELVPFRLSPQLCQLMTPHPAKHGRLRQSMLLSLSTLQENQDTVLTMLDVFLKEPSIDWLKHANSFIKVHGTSGSMLDSGSSTEPSNTTSDVQWYPLRKIERVKKKLAGCHPTQITLDELQYNIRISKSHRNAFKAVATGMKGKCNRVSKLEEKLDVNTQVDCLIDQATDPNVVGRSWWGWRYWI